MKSVRRVTALLLLALTAAAAPTWAFGPLDGSYAATVTIPSVPDLEPFTIYVVVLQNDNQFGMALLDETGFWTYGFGTLDAENHVTGPIIDPYYGDSGQFDLRFQGGTVTGSFSYFDETATLSGEKFF